MRLQEPPNYTVIKKGCPLFDLSFDKSCNRVSLLQDKPKASGDAVTKIYEVGCLKAVGTYINEHAIVIGGVMLGVLIPQVGVNTYNNTLIISR